MQTFSPELCRGGRAMLAWRRQDLAKESRVSIRAIADFETDKGKRGPNVSTLTNLQRTLEDAGLTFLNVGEPDEGVSFNPKVKRPSKS